jgi:hypothetical protein
VAYLTGGAEGDPFNDEAADVTKAAETNPGFLAHLGGFGFSRSDGGSRFLHLPRGSSTDRAARDKFWLADPNLYISGILSKLGDIDPRLASKLLLGAPSTNQDTDDEQTRKGEVRNSIDFIPVTQDRLTTRIRFRSAARAIASIDADGDITVRNGKFRIADPARTGRRIQSDSEDLLVELELDYRIPDDEAIWTVVRNAAASEPLDPLAATLRVRVGIGAEIDAQTARGELHDDDPVPAPKHFFGQAIRSMRLARMGLANIEATQPQSLLPEIDFGKDQKVRLALCAELPARFEPSDGPGGFVDRLIWDGAPGARAQWRGAGFTFTLWPDTARLPLLTGEGNRLSASMTLPALAPGAVIPVTLGHDDAEAQDSLRRWVFRVSADPPIGALTAILGGLEFTLAKDRSAADNRLAVNDAAIGDSHYDFWRFRPAEPLRAPPGRDNYRAPDVDLRFALAVSAIKPLGADRPRDQREGARPLLIQPWAKSGTGGQFILDAREQIGPDADRLLTANIIDKGEGETGAGDYLLLSQEPFSIKKVRSQPLQQRGSQDNAYVASYNSDTRGWEFKLVAPTYHYAFPPQAVGETMDKPRRLEIHDPDGSKAAPIPPALSPNADGVARRHAVEFRLTPSAELWVRPSDVERGYFHPEWATEQLFAANGAYGLGVAVAAFRAEFLYGLSVGVDTGRENGAARGARVAEIGALLGRPPGPIESANPDPTLRRRWDAVRRSVLRRPERLEMWMRDPGGAAPFAPARFSDGVTFALRRTAVHFPPHRNLEATPPGPSPNGPRLVPHGLRGGAIWPLESANLCRALIDNPDSNGGTIERIALSPGGGDADQRAEFLRGQLAIISETRNGHVQRHRVEIIGRISVFWHRAKHVVVYERTTNPSAQFTPEGGVGQRTRRPVLRKVSEYIELLQPVRPYPDFANARADAAGFLRAVRFNSRTIHVDSAWSEDVDDFGWRIPLWNRHAATVRPQVYPRPDIAFVTVAEGEGDAPTAAQECLDPDNIYFFADAKAGTADTDAWIARIGIDCTNLPAPAPDHQPELGTTAPDERRKPNAPRIPRGHRRYTWRLAPAARKTILNAERGSEPLFAGLETITFMRSAAGEPDSARSRLLADQLKGFQKLETFAAVSDLSGRLRRAAAGSDDDLRNEAAAILAQLGDLDVGKGDAKAFLDRLGTLESLTSGAPTRCQKMADDFAGSLQRKKLLVLDRLQTWAAKPQNVRFPKPDDIILPPEELADLLSQLAMAEVRPALAGVQDDIGKLKLAVEQGRSAVRDLEADILGILAGGRRKLAVLKASYDQEKPWSAHRMQEYHRRISTIRDGVVGDIAAAANEIQSRLATELDAAAHGIAQALGRQLALIAAGEGALSVNLRRVEGAGSGFLWSLHDRLGKTVAALDALVRKVRATLKPGSLDASILSTLLERIDQFRLDAKQGQELLAAAARKVHATSSELETALTTGSAALQSIVHGAASLASDVVAAVSTLVEVGKPARAEIEAAVGAVAAKPQALIDTLPALGKLPDEMVNYLDAQLNDAAASIAGIAGDCFRTIDDAAKVAAALLGTIQEQLEPSTIETLIEEHVVAPAVRQVLSGVIFKTGEQWAVESLAKLSEALDQLGKVAGALLDDFDRRAATWLADLRAESSKVCKLLGAGLDSARAAIEARLKEIIKPVADIVEEFEEAAKDLEKLRQIAGKLARDIDKVGDELTASYGAAHAYADRVFEAAGNVTSGGLAAAPSNILRLYAAAASAPALPNLDFARERLGYYYKELNKVIDTTPAEAWFGRLGDELKAMGLSLPFKSIGDGILPDDLSRFDIGRVFKNFGGIDLSKLFGGYKLPAGARDAIRITHAFDKKLFRAWVQIDVDLPLPGRKSLFTVGPFKLDFVGSRMVGMVRLEASKDGDKVEQTGRASLTTSIDAVVSGQSMVTLEDVAIRYERTSGLKVDFDPRKIRLNPSLRFIQETLGSLFPAEVGGLKVVKRNGIPVGVEHEFTMPPVSLMYGTSGVSNIQITNSFSLIAYPDFAIANRFALSSPEMPFLFSIFVIGGTGYINVDCEYRPFSNNGELMVVVEAAAGGSAALGFAAGPISGSVFITLSIALSYRKLIGKSGGGLTVSLVLLVAGTVDVAGIVSVYIGVLLRMAYRENGQIDGVGTVTVKIRISRFYTLRVRRDVKKVLRKGGGGAGGRTQLRLREAVAGDRAAMARGRMILEARG